MPRIPLRLLSNLAPNIPRSGASNIERQTANRSITGTERRSSALSTSTTRSDPTDSITGMGRGSSWSVGPVRHGREIVSRTGTSLVRSNPTDSITGMGRGSAWAVRETHSEREVAGTVIGRESAAHMEREVASRSMTGMGRGSAWTVGPTISEREVTRRVISPGSAAYAEREVARRSSTGDPSRSITGMGRGSGWTVGAACIVHHAQGNRRDSPASRSQDEGRGESGEGEYLWYYLW